MEVSDQEYNEPEKCKVRKLLLTHAVDALTTGRSSSAIVQESRFRDMLSFVEESFMLPKVVGAYPREAIRDFAEVWLKVLDSRISNRTARDLQVLILCGPNPENDLMELMRLGVSPFNVWAVESNEKAYRSAIDKLRNLGLPLRLYKGNLGEFFSIVPQQFDIVYFDACGPLADGKPETLSVLQQLFVSQRLNPLSALITNFSYANTDGLHTEEWTDRFISWFAPVDQPVECAFGDPAYNFMYHLANNDGGAYRTHVRDNFRDYYSDFITSFIAEFAGQLLPWWRTCALKGVSEQLFAKPQIRIKAIEQSLKISEGPPDKFSEWIEGFGHAQLVPEAYPFLWRSVLISELREGDPLRRLFCGEKFKNVFLSDAAKIWSLIRNFGEWEHNNEACSDEFSRVLTRFRWFDSPSQKWDGLFCDTPFEHLIADLCIGQAGYPYHVNVEKLLRIYYQAKVTQMYSDVFVFDQMRYLYDLIPAVPLLDQKLPLDMAIVTRICMHYLMCNARNICPDLLYGCHLAGYGEGPMSNLSFEVPDRFKIS